MKWSYHCIVLSGRCPASYSEPWFHFQQAVNCQRQLAVFPIFAAYLTLFVGQSKELVIDWIVTAWSGVMSSNIWDVQPTFVAEKPRDWTQRRHVGARVNGLDLRVCWLRMLLGLWSNGRNTSRGSRIYDAGVMKIGVASRCGRSNSPDQKFYVSLNIFTIMSISTDLSINPMMNRGNVLHKSVLTMIMNNEKNNAWIIIIIIITSDAPCWNTGVRKW